MSNLCKPDKRRLLAALNHEKSDRVPNFEILIDNKASKQILGLPAGGEKITSWTLNPRDAVRLMTKVGQDAVACSLTWMGTGEGTILTHDDFDKVIVPDPAGARDTMKPWIDAVTGTGMGLCARMSGPLTLSYCVAGPVPIESFMYMLYDDLPLVERMMDTYTDYHLAVIHAIADLPFDFFYIGDDLSSSTGPLISPDHIKELWAPRTERLIRAAQALGKPIIFHCCGMQAPILPYMLEWGVNAVHPIQPVANDIYAMKKKYGAKLTLVGNIDVASELSFGTEEDTRRSVRKHIDELADGSYVVCSSHSIIDSVKPENYLAMCDETQKYGAYQSV
jgi:uroporphyrinogen decarboxylase